MFEQALRWLLVGAFCSTAATCGQKGPLELPDEQTTSAAKSYEARRPVSVCFSPGEFDGLRT